MDFLTESSSLFNDAAPAFNDDPFWETLSTAPNSASASPLYDNDFESFNVDDMLGDMPINLDHFELSVQPTRPASPVLNGFLDMPLVPSPAPSVLSSCPPLEPVVVAAAATAPVLAPAAKRRAVQATISTEEYEVESVSSGRLTGEDEYVEVEEDFDVQLLAPRPTKKRSRDTSAADFETKRNTHNVLERKRRDELKGSFDELRECVPSLADDHRAPKVLILRRACDYVEHLRREDVRITMEKEKAKAEHARLLARLEFLRRKQ